MDIRFWDWEPIVWSAIKNGFLMWIGYWKSAYRRMNPGDKYPLRFAGESHVVEDALQNTSLLG